MKKSTIVMMIIAAVVLVVVLVVGTMDKDGGGADGFGNTVAEVPPAEESDINPDSDNYVYHASADGDDDFDPYQYPSFHEDFDMDEIYGFGETVNESEETAGGDEGGSSDVARLSVSDLTESRESFNRARARAQEESGMAEKETRSVSGNAVSESRRKPKARSGSGSTASASVPERKSVSTETGAPVSVDTSRAVAESKPEAAQSAVAASEPKVYRRSGIVTSLGRGGSSAGMSALTSDAGMFEEEPDKPVLCQFTRDGKVTTGQRVVIRTLEDMVVDGVFVPKNMDLFATARVGDRLELEVTGFKMDGVVYRVSFDAYDSDGLRGLYSTAASQAGRQARSRALQIGSGTVRRGVGNVAGEIISAGTSIASGVQSEASCRVSSGYRFYIRKSVHR